MKNLNENLADKILLISPDELEKHSVIQPSRSGGYNCPHCDNGQGEDGTGIEIANMGDHFGAFCHKCGESFNNFHFLARHYHLDRKADFQEIVKRTVEEFHLLDSPTPVKKIAVNKKISTSELDLILNDIEIAQNNLQSFVESQGGSWRGLSLETLLRFHCGFLPAWIHPKNKLANKNLYPTRRFIIPTQHHYNAVLLSEDRIAENKKWWKMHAGNKELFALDFLPVDSDFLILTEGEIDAMSIWQATDGKYDVVATGGAAEKNFVETLNEKFSNHKPNILVLLDPDDAGRKNAPKLCKLLGKNNFKATFKFLADDVCSLDSNQILQQQGDFALAELIDTLVGDAKKNFNKVPDVPVETPQPHFDKYSTQSIIPDCPVDYYLPINFGFGENGITRSSKSQGDIVVSHTPVVITHRFIDPKTYTVKYEIAFRGYSDKWTKKVVDKSVLSDHKKIIQLAEFDIDFTSSEAKYLSQFFMDFIHAGDNAQKMKTIDAYNQPGWDDDCTKFIYPAGGEDYICHRNGYDYKKLFKPKGNKNAWIEKFKEVSDKGGSVARMIIGAAMASPLVKPFNLPNIQVHLEGKRGIGKTAIPKFAVSVFGDSRQGRLSRTFKATSKNNLETAAAFCDLPIILDELETLNKADENKLSNMIYDFSLGVGNQANKRDGSARSPIEFSGCRISTGERPLVKFNDKAGAFKRVLNIRAKSSLLDDSFASELHQFSEQNCGLLGKLWIDYLQLHLSDIKFEFYSMLDLAKKSGVLDDSQFRKVDIEPTQLKTAILSAVAYKHFCKCIGVEFSDETMFRDIADIVLDLPSKHEIDDTERAKDALASFVAGHLKNFVKENSKSADYPETSAEAYETYGKIFENGEVAFLPHKLRQILEVDLGFASADKLIAEWADEDKFRIQDGRRYKSYINGDKIWTYRFKAGILRNRDDLAA